MIISIAVYAYFKSFACGAASFLTGVFLDVDHILDCYMNHGPRFKLEDLSRFCAEIRFKKLTLIFHSYELIAVLWISIYAFSLGNIWIAMAIGATQHLIFDRLFNNKIGGLGYFFTFRLINGFAKEAIIKR
ncbi:MAG: hypothetical protein ISS34_04370 [Candidatus Omnitrophica bacterium]|nr:hypothetical protein [Candidatus Omnitrophota bacterium]